MELKSELILNDDEYVFLIRKYDLLDYSEEEIELKIKSLDSNFSLRIFEICQ